MERTLLYLIFIIVHNVLPITWLSSFAESTGSLLMSNNWQKRPTPLQTCPFPSTSSTMPLTALPPIWKAATQTESCSTSWSLQMRYGQWCLFSTRQNEKKVRVFVNGGYNLDESASTTRVWHAEPEGGGRVHKLKLEIYRKWRGPWYSSQIERMRPWCFFVTPVPKMLPPKCTHRIFT